MSEAALEKAEKLASQKRWEEAAAALADAGGSDLICERKGFYLSRAAEYPAAIEVFEDLCRRNPNSARYRYMLGFQFSQLERYGEAIEHLRSAVGLAPGYIKAHYRLAQAHLRAGNVVPAQLAAIQVLRLWDKAGEQAQQRDARLLARACYLLAKLQLRRDPEGAVELLRRAVEHEPSDHNKHYLLGKALTRAGNPLEALEALARAKRIEPRKAYIDLELVRALSDNGQREEAIETLRKAAKHCRAWDAYNAGRLAKALEQPDLARTMLEAANRRGPTRGDSRIRELLSELQATPTASRERKDRDDSGRDDPGQGTGEVVYLNPKKHFGFLVDRDGTKRHFRTKDKTELRKGAVVSFLPKDQEKGPAASDVRAAS